MADFQELLARMKSPAGPPGAAETQSFGISPGGNHHSNYQPPSISSPIFSPSPGGPQPHHQSAIMSPSSSIANTPAPEQSSADRTANLLNLLKFSQASQSGSPSTPSHEHRLSQGAYQSSQAEPVVQQARVISASDLVASFMRKQTSSLPSHAASFTPPVPAKVDSPSASATENPQELLLRLLNHPKPAQSDSSSLKHRSGSAEALENAMPEPVVDDIARDFEEASLQTPEPTPPLPQRERLSPARVFGDGSVSQSTTFEPPRATKGPLFTYVNPFEQLSASSPRNRASKPETRPSVATPKVEILKHSRDTSSGPSATDKAEAAELSEPAAKTRKLSADAVRVPVGPSAHVPKSKDTHAKHHESVSEALSGVGQEVDKQVEAALAQAEAEVHDRSPAEQTSPRQKDQEAKEAEEAAQEVAVGSKQELKEENGREFEESPPAPTPPAPAPVATEAAVGDIVQQNVADSWESAEDSADRGEEFVIRVYNFPMRPFVSIEIMLLQDPPTPFRQENMLEIARFKKEFDQIDRTLCAATRNFIGYGLSKHGGFRLIRQDTGEYKQVFHTTRDRLFNIAICPDSPGSAATDQEAILATGVSGTVYWTSITVSKGDSFGEENLENQGLIFPPVPANDDNTSGSQLKTRAKKSCRHPEFFGIGRGKSIYIVWPKLARTERYTDQKTRVCDSEKYLRERCLRISTGKAGKDFTFSEDDSVIVSLDKAGKMKFWDIRTLTDEDKLNAEQMEAIDIKTPMLTYNTTSPSDKSWPTSVLFVDKDRPCQKGIALRYLIVGMKQNHTLQLWDLNLGKPVQEINFPHEKESDAICSIAYNPRSGIIAVGHPTRNSIYLIHLSAPRYNMPVMNQARFIQRLVANDGTLPKPESTAIMSGIREFSFASKGQLRSLDMLHSPMAAGDSSNSDQDDNPMFELYVMHSKGVTCLTVKRDDLGWTKESKVLHPIDAEKTGAIRVSHLRTPPEVVQADASANGETSTQTTATSGSAKAGTSHHSKRDVASGRGRSQTPETSTIAAALSRGEKQDASRAATANGTEKAEKRKKKRSSAAAEPASQPSAAASVPVPTLAAPASYAMAAQRATTPSPQPSSPPKKGPESAAKSLETEAPQWAKDLVGQVAPPASADAIEKTLGEGVKKLGDKVNADLSKSLHKEFEALYRRLEDDKRVHDASSSARHEAVLRLISSTLSENVEKTLTRIITTSVQNVIVPAVSEIISTALDRRLAEVLEPAIKGAVPKELRSSLPNAINRALKEPDIVRGITETVSGKIAGVVEAQASSTLQTAIAPAFNALAVNAAQNISKDIERGIGEQLRFADVQRHQDSLKFDQLNNQVRVLTDTVHNLIAQQAKFLEAQKQGSHSREVSVRSTGSAAAQPGLPTKSKEELEIESISEKLAQGDYESATIMWLHSENQADLFDSLFIRYNPSLVLRLTPLVALSVSAAITARFESDAVEHNLNERLHWLETILSSIDPHDPDIYEVIPRIIDVLALRLQSAFMKIAEANSQSPTLRKIAALSKQTNDLKTIRR